MQSSPEKNSVFKLTWKINNFTMFPYESGEPLWSPIIGTDLLAGTKWKIGLCMSEKRYKNEHYITGIVYREKSEKGNDPKEAIPVSLAISLKNADGSYSTMCEKNYVFCEDKGYGIPLIPERDIFQKKKYLHPCDTFIMECQLRKNDAHNYGFDTKLAPEQAREAAKNVLEPMVAKCLIRTRFNVEELRFVWAIPRFGTVNFHQKQIYFAGENSPTFVLALIPNELTQSPEESMVIKLSARSNESFHCSYEILLVDSDFVSRIRMKGKHFFEIGSSMSYEVPNSLKWGDKHLRLVDETLALHCKFEIAGSSSVKSFIEQTTYFPPKFGVYSSTRDEDVKPKDQIIEQSEARKFCDLSLLVEGKMFRTHKILLCTWSSEFKKILEQDLDEGCPVLEINDIEVETADRMLRFLYTQTVEDLDWKETMKLYLAADKYKIKSLLENCSSCLVSKLSVTNVCDWLIFADTQANEELVKFATNFVKEWRDKVLRTEDWKNLMEVKGALAAKLMHEMFIED